MTDEVRLSPEAAAVANRIRALDHELDVMEQQQRDSLEQGMRALGSLGGSLSRLSRREDSDQEHQKLLDERADLVVRLKQMVAQLEQPASDD